MRWSTADRLVHSIYRLVGHSDPSVGKRLGQIDSGMLSDTAIHFPKYQGIKRYAMLVRQCWLVVERLPELALLGFDRPDWVEAVHSSL